MTTRPHEGAIARLMRAAAEAADCDALLDEASEALDEGDAEEALALCARARKALGKRGDPRLQHDVCLLEGMALEQLGDTETALQRMEEAAALAPDSLDAALERALVLFELCRFEAAETALRALVDRLPEEPWVAHTLGLIAERRGDTADAKRLFARARQLAPDEFPSPVELSEAEFDDAVEAAVRKLPEQVRPYLENVTISVEPIPSDEDLLAERPPLSPTILGVFRGTPIGERSVTSAEDHFPAAIVLYQANLQRFARTQAELVEQIGITVMHEVGHLIGLDEDDLEERGLD